MKKGHFVQAGNASVRVWVREDPQGDYRAGRGGRRYPDHASNPKSKLVGRNFG
jgi:hypothetical protein